MSRRYNPPHTGVSMTDLFFILYLFYYHALIGTLKNSRACLVDNSFKTNLLIMQRWSFSCLDLHILVYYFLLLATNCKQLLRQIDSYSSFSRIHTEYLRKPSYSQFTKKDPMSQCVSPSFLLSLILLFSIPDRILKRASTRWVLMLWTTQRD